MEDEDGMLLVNALSWERPNENVTLQDKVLPDKLSDEKEC
jgi:hypothetical protein